MYFEDAAGSRDTIEFGFDDLATDSIDASFGEVNIIANTPGPGLEVRISDEWDRRVNQGQAAGSYHCKKQIVEKVCPGFVSPNFMMVVLDIKTDNWPVTAAWDSIPFETAISDTLGDCYGIAYLTAAAPYSWWGVPAAISNLPVVGLGESASYTFSANFNGTNINPDFNYKNAWGDTVSYFWLTLNEGTFYLVNSTEPAVSNEISVYPNPGRKGGQVKIEPDQGAIKEVLLFDLLGNEVPASYSNGQLDLSQVSAGLYILKGVLADGNGFAKRLLIQ